MRLLEQDLINPSLVTVQSCILISQYLGGEGNVKAKHIYVGVAMLHSQVIRLSQTIEVINQSDIVTREVRRRTWLSVVIADRWSSADMSTLSKTSGESNPAYLVADEKEFMALNHTTGQSYAAPLGSSENGLWAQMAKTIETFRHISETIHALGSGQSSISSQQDNIVHLTIKLDEWEQGLPTGLSFTTENLEYFHSFGFGKTFLAMHIGFHHFRQLLYFPFLDSRRTSVANPQLRYIELCKMNAMQVSHIASISRRTGGCDLLYYIIGHILVVSSSVHLHTLLFSDLEEADLARGHLVSNFETLMELKTYWPVIDSMVSFTPHQRY